MTRSRVSQRNPPSPTDAELVDALEAYERQAEEERLHEAAAEEGAEAEPEWGPGTSTPERLGTTEPGEHRRRRQLATTLADTGDEP